MGLTAEPVDAVAVPYRIAKTTIQPVAVSPAKLDGGGNSGQSDTVTDSRLLSGS